MANVAPGSAGGQSLADLLNPAGTQGDPAPQVPADLLHAAQTVAAGQAAKKAEPAAAPADAPATGGYAQWEPTVQKYAHQYGVDPAVIRAILYNEGTGGNPASGGDGGLSWGLAQIYLPANPGITKSQAQNPDFAIRYIAQRVAAFKAAHPGADGIAQVIQHNSPVAALTYLRTGNLTAADAQTGNGKYGSQAKALLGGSAQQPLMGAAGIQSGSAGSLDAGSPASGDLGTPTPLTVQQYLDNPLISSQYGYLAGFLNDPEIGPILAEASQQGWGQNQLLGALSKTHWWQTTTAASRQWQATRSIDPNAWNTAVKNVSDTIYSEARALGVAGKLDPHRIGLMAQTALNSGYASADGGVSNQNWLRGSLASEFTYSGKAAPGQAGQAIDALRQQAGNYLVPLADQTMQGWVRQILAGTATAQDFTDYLQQQARSLWPTLSAQFDQGFTTQQAIDPYRQLISKTLEVTPDQVDFMDPKWRALIDQVNPKDGTRTMMSLADAQRKLMTDPTYGYDHTQQAIQNAASFGQSFLQEFGYEPGGTGMLSVG